ncbi:TPR-like protein [Cadophora sp. DSE1049]|nr:TPR-like protein [Cadophora sp. DSE1049]
MSIIALSDDDPLDHSATVPTVDLVAIHGLYEGQLDTWTDPQTTLLWLRDLFPHNELNVRVLAYGYGTASLLEPGGTADGILPHATSFIAELCAFRGLSNTSERPIIFVCHGFGGILLKRALVFSSASQGDHVQHRRSIYTSTHAILFMGTPHNGMSKDAILGLSKHRLRGPSQFSLSLLKSSEVLTNITDLFSPLMKQFMISYFWEQRDTTVRSFKGRIVDEISAAPTWHNVDRCGLLANHSGMVKFGNSQDRGYPVVFATLRRYIKSAPEVISSRWRQQKPIVEEHRIGVQIQPQDKPAAAEPTQTGITTDPEDINEIYAVLRSSSNYFTGRKLYSADLKEAFSAPRSQSISHRQKVFVVFGLGGSGKTQFCLKYIEDNKSSYWGVFWIDASSDENAESGFASMALQAGKGASFAAGIHWLSSQSKPWMLVIDNADDVEMDITKYFPSGSNGHILVTTRNPEVATSQATIGSFCFRGMDPDEATALLLRSAHLFSAETSNDQSKELARGIALELGYLALALTHAGATIRRHIYTLDKYLHYYLGWRREMMSQSSIGDADDANIITTWEIPFRKIEARPSVDYRDAVDVMHIFAFMHFESIPESIFQAFWNSANGAETSLAGHPDILQNLSMLNEEAHARMRKAFRVLCDYSIIDYDPEQKSCSLHPVVHTWARRRLAPNEYARWLTCTTSMIAQCISSNLEASGREFRRQLISHIDAVLRSLQHRFPSLPETAKQADELEKFASVYAENGLWKQARSLLRKVIEWRAKTLGKRHMETLRAQKRLADIHWNLFEVESCVGIQRDLLWSHWLFRSSVSDWVIWPPWYPDHVSYCVALSDLTQSLWLAGKLDLSQWVGERAVNGLTKHLGPDDPITLNAMFNLGRTYHHLREYKKSYEYLVCVVKKRKHFFGLDHPDTLMARTELGTSYHAFGRISLAEKMIGNVLEARKRTLGEEHAYTLWSVIEYSKVLCDLGRCEQAVTMLEDIVPIVTRTLGEDHVGMSFTQSNLARAYAISKRWTEAADILKKLTVADKIADHPDRVNIMCGYIHVRVKMGQLEETEDDCKELLDAITKQKVISLRDPLTFGIAETLVNIYQQTRRDGEIALLKKQLPGLETKLEERSTCENSIFSELYAAKSELKGKPGLGNRISS